MPLVSIGMPIYNSEKTLRLAIDSILGQTMSDFELIISDNCSTDATSSICRDYASRDSRIIYTRQTSNIGGERNFKFTLDQGRSKYFMWAAGDDIRTNDFLEVNVNFLELNADYIASTSPNCFEGEVLNRNSHVVFDLVGPIEDRFIYFFDNCFQSHGIFYSLFRKEALCDPLMVNECFDRSYGFAMDWQVNLLLASQGNIHRSNIGMTILGENGISRTGNPWATYRSFWLEWIIPFYKFNPYVLKLIRNLPLIAKMKIIKRLIKFNFAVAYRPMYAILYPNFYPPYSRYIKPFIKGGHSN